MQADPRTRTRSLMTGYPGDPSPRRHRPEAAEFSPSWAYRVALNPRYRWLPIVVFQAGFGVVFLLDVDLAAPGETYVALAVAASFFGMAALLPKIAGFTNMRTPRRMSSPEKRVEPESLWVLHIPLFVVLVGMGTALLLELERPLPDAFYAVISYHVLIGGAWFLIAVAALSVIVAGHRRELVFTPDALEYTRGRFRARIPWTAVTALQPVCDANIKSGGLGSLGTPSRRNLRAGVQMFVRDLDLIEVHRRTMLFRIAGRHAVSVDCSSYTIDANTLINAIYELVEHPQLRPLLDSPDGAELFVGPDWTTRRTMRVGDRWDRLTGEVVRAADADDGFRPLER